MKIYLVGDYGPEHNSVKSVHRTKAGALKAWNRHRLGLLHEAKQSLKRNKTDKDMWKEMIKNLSCKDPKKIDNGAQETPYVSGKWKLKNKYDQERRQILGRGQLCRDHELRGCEEEENLPYEP